MKYGYKIAEINTVPVADFLIDCKNLVANNTNHTHIIIPLIKTL